MTFFNRRKKLFYILVGFLVIIVSLETYLRVFKYETLKTFKRDLAYVPDTLYGFRYKPNSEHHLVWHDIDKKFRYNNQGFYGPDFSTEKPAGVFRIAVVGISLTFGLKSDGHENFIIMLDKMFKEKGRKIEVINCSVDGEFRDIGNMNMAKHLIPAFKPDIILYEYSFPVYKRHHATSQYKDYMIRYDFSDTNSVREIKEEIDLIYSAKISRAIYDNSYIIRAMAKVLIDNVKVEYDPSQKSVLDNIRLVKSYIKKDRIKIKTGKNKKYTEQESIDIYNNLNNYLDSLNIKLAVFSFDKYDPYFKKQPLIILDEISVSDKSYYLENDGHFNMKGHRVVANELYNRTIKILPSERQ